MERRQTPFLGGSYFSFKCLQAFGKKYLLYLSYFLLINFVENCKETYASALPQETPQQNALLQCTNSILHHFCTSSTYLLIREAASAEPNFHISLASFLFVPPKLCGSFSASNVQEEQCYSDFKCILLQSNHVNGIYTSRRQIGA